jgi:hypothetical protein
MSSGRRAIVARRNAGDQSLARLSRSFDLGSPIALSPTLPPTMSPGLADVPRNVDSRVQSPKNTFDREPLLIPQIFVSGKPWYRRRAPWVTLVLSAILMLVVAYLVHRFTAVGLLKRFGKLVG